MRPVVRSLYAHIPFCRVVCGYCDFYKRKHDPDAVDPLLDALTSEHARHAAACELHYQTIFVGGGTPTTLTPAQLTRLTTLCTQHAGPDCEFTMEANPATISREKADALAAGGVNRVSIGAQSFHPSELAVLDRDHQPDQVAETVATCRAAGVRRVSLDLIFGVPGQSLASWRASLDAALALEPEHLSCYGLTYEPGTPLHRRRAAGRFTPLPNELEAELYELTIETLAAAGFKQYEISNFARPGAACRHNLVYWENEPCLGVGPSAAGFDGTRRYRNVPDLAEYARRIHAGVDAFDESETLSNAHRARETAMLNLRLTRGIDRAAFARRFELDPTAFFADAIATNAARGWLEVTPDAIRLTRAGLLMADSVIGDFLTPTPAP